MDHELLQSEGWLEDFSYETILGRFAKGRFPKHKGGFGRCFWTPKTGMRVQKTEQRYQKPERRCIRQNCPCYKTALLFPLEIPGATRGILFKRGADNTRSWTWPHLL